jgi:Domain of unknown function (DUF1918)
MQGSIGDHIVVRGHRTGEHDRHGEILGIRGEGGAPPYLVRWDDSDHEVLFFPGPDVVIEHLPAER